MSMYKYWLKYPKELTPAYWNKHKGVIAKVLKKKTGVTESLKKAEAAFKKIKPQLFHEATVDMSTKAACKQAAAALASHFNSEVKKCTDALRELRTLAEKRRKEFGKNILVRSATKELKKIEDKAQKHTDDIRQFILDAIADIKAEMANVA